MKYLKTRGWLVLTVFFTVLLLIVACKFSYKNNAVDKSLRFAQLPITYSAVTFIAEANGYYKGDDLDYISFSVPAGPDVVTSLKAKGGAGADAGGIAITPVVTMIGAGDDPVILATTMTSDRQAKLVTFSATGITENPATLKGKTIGVVKNTNGDIYLSRLLKKGGLTASDVTLVNGRPADLRNLLVQGKIDATVLWDPFVIQAQKDYKRLLAGGETKDRGEVQVFVDPSIDTLAFNIVTTRDKIATKRDALIKMLRGTIKASEFIQNNPQEAQAMLEKWLNLDKGDLDDFMKTTDFHLYLDVPQVKKWLSEELLWLKGNQPDAKIPADLSNYVDSSLLRTVDPSRVNE